MINTFTPIFTDEQVEIKPMIARCTWRWITLCACSARQFTDKQKIHIWRRHCNYFIVGRIGCEEKWTWIILKRIYCIVYFYRSIEGCHIELIWWGRSCVLRGNLHNNRRNVCLPCWTQTIRQSDCWCFTHYPWTLLKRIFYVIWIYLRYCCLPP